MNSDSLDFTNSLNQLYKEMLIFTIRKWLCTDIHKCKISKKIYHYFLDWIGKLKLGISFAVEIDFDDISDILLPIEILLSGLIEKFDSVVPGRDILINCKTYMNILATQCCYT